MMKRFTYTFFILSTVFLDIGSVVFLANKLNSDLTLLLHINEDFSLVRLLAFVFIWLLLGTYFSIYTHKRADRFLRLTLRLSSHLITFFVFIELFSASIFSRIPKIEDVLLLGLILITQLTYRFFFFSLIRSLRTKNKLFKDTVVLLGDNTQGIASFIQNNPQIGYNILAVDLEEDVIISKDFLKRQRPSAVFMHQKNANRKKYKAVLEKLALHQIPIRIFASHDNVFRSNQVDYFGFIPIYKTQFSPLLQGANRYIKRIFDIVFSLFVIIFILSWMYPLVALLIKLESKGPVLFVQNRNGLGNELFRCYKFRSMTTNNSVAQVIKDDMRITRIGKIIRKTSIDEFPQFFNVLKGDMSVVGPRPHMEIHNANYEKHVESFQLRHTIKPGITGMAQSRGFRGEIREDLDIINRIKYDIFYIRHWSFALDIKIIIRTVLNIFRGEDKAY
ncbi:MAG: UDP-glucose:undecaprenyl-phosphate glucose-1-phosphate transferase [Bacteroidota bacterium]|nr:MAG: UDP-glucose:undecaprenyl-phosphate glucose-1-phosphate transferase [Bacteroidota bacterium]